MKTESVWDYPRPPRLEKTTRRIRVVQGGVAIVDTTEAMRVLETSHPPVYYVPASAVAVGAVRPSGSRASFCEFKGSASYWDLMTTDGVVRDVAWSYARPSHGFEPLAGHLAFYASKVEECWVDDERVVPQEGDFYGGWITKDVVGPFKGGKGTWGW
jgi:uncharacterized protein (DUF427 family)